VVQGGPFTGNTAQDITNWRRDFGAGRMGHLSATYPS
jgi:hypothetical protein